MRREHLYLQDIREACEMIQTWTLLSIPTSRCSGTWCGQPPPMTSPCFVARFLRF